MLRSPRGFDYAFGEFITEVAYIIVSEVLRPEDVNAVRAFENRTPELLDSGLVYVLEHWEAQASSREGQIDDHTLLLMHHHDVVEQILEDSAINSATELIAYLDPLVEERKNELVYDEDDLEEEEDDLSSPLLPPSL